jgi:hypothetical protein
VTAPPAGVLEELDGGSIGPRPASSTVGWSRAMVHASIVALSRPRLWVFALLSFLARGGLVVLVVPMLVLPTFVGISNTVGPTSVTAAGPTSRLVAMVAAWAGITLVAIVAGTIAAAAAEVALHRATVAPPWGSGAVPGILRSPAASLRPMRGTLRRVVSVRLVLLAPVAVALAAAVPAWVQVGYQELVLPSNLAVPLPVRVIAGAPTGGVLVILAWLVAEVLGGVAARRIVLDGSSAAGSLWQAVRDVARAPVSAVLTTALAIGGTLLVMVPVVVTVGAAWDHARVALVDGRDPAGVLVATFALVAAWAGCLAVAGIAAGWRSALWTAEVARHPRTG